MTNHVNISITFTIENGKQNKLHFKLSAETLGKDLKRIEESLKVGLNTSVVMYLDDRIKETAMKGVKVIGTEKRTIVTEAGAIEVNRRVYRRADGKRVKPLDQLLGIAPYERRNHAVREIESVIAARSNYRSAAEVCTKISGVPVSAATIGRDVRRLGNEIAAQDQNYFPKQKGKIQSEVLYGESDGILVRLQKDREGKKSAEIRMAIAYTDKVWLSGKRKRLENKLTLTAIDIPTLQWQEMICNHLYGHYDMDSVKLMAVGGDGGAWVGSSFDFCGVKRIERVLDPFHIRKSIRTAFGDSLPLREVFDRLFHEGFEAVCDRLSDLLFTGSTSERRAKRHCYNYLSRHHEEIVPLSERGLPFERLGTMGCIESNIGKTIALRMKTRGCSWSREGAKAMSAILCHLPQLEQKAFTFEKLPVLARNSNDAKKRQNTSAHSSIHTASFPILKNGKVSTPYYNFFKNIINPKELP